MNVEQNQKDHLPIDPQILSGYPAVMAGSSDISTSNVARLRSTPITFEMDAHKFYPNPEETVHVERPAYEDLGELPEAYGTRSLFLSAKDPYFLFACWDFTREQFFGARSCAHDHKVFLQVYQATGERTAQVEVGWGFQNYMIPAQPDTFYYAEVGYYRHDGHFEALARSQDCHTPRDAMSWKTDVDWVTIPFHFPFRQLRELIAEHMLPGEQLAQALARLQREGFSFPFETFASKDLSEQAHQALLNYLRSDYVRKIQMGSIEVTEIVRKHLARNINSEGWTENISSPMGASFGAHPREFFMHLNAELIIYGGTDPHAKVRIDGRPITLRSDGTFSYHFRFSDGRYHIPIEATSADQVETRSALLSFLRMTSTSGDVDATPQPPLPEPMGKKKRN